MLRRFIAILVLLWPMSAVADEYADRREACAPVVTALYEDCSIHNYRRCPSGEVYIEQIMPGPIEIAKLFGPDFELIYQRNMTDGTDIVDVIVATDPFSLASLIATGEEQTDVLATTSSTGFAQETRMQSTAKITNETRTVSRYDLRIVSVNFRMALGFGGNTLTIQGHEYLDLNLMLLFPGPATYVFAGEPIREAPELMNLLGPDSPNFMAQIPEETCQDQLSSLTSDPILQVETPHDNL